ncbi:MAG: HAMP domain-containing protein [Elainella sp. C42_A2020_010]|nr:HAMP domain-containing protein [Elainella sp. C42_A2020_010]
MFRERAFSVKNPDHRVTASSSSARFRWPEVWGEARTRVLVWYTVILALAFGLAIPAFRQRLFDRVEARVQQDIWGEVRDFRELLSGRIDLESLENNRMEHFHPIDPDPARPAPLPPADAREAALMRDLQLPTTAAEARRFFSAYLQVEIPEDNIYLITFVDGQFYQSSPVALPRDFRPDTPLMRRWATQTEPEQGEQTSLYNENDRILYVVEPVKANGKLLGTWVVAHSVIGERAEVLEAVGVVIQVSLVVLAISLLLAWFAAGRVLQPLRVLTATIQSISETDLTRRIPVQGQGELAKLATTFNDMMDRLESSFISQRNFVNDAGHELRTPITIMRGHLELMSSHPDEQQDTLEVVMDELDRMSRFVEDLVLLAKAERPNFLQLETVDAEALTHELFVKAQVLAPRNWQLESVAKGRIVVDRQRIIQAVMNLAQNATQHTEPDDTITIGSAIRKDKVHFWVRDTGAGIRLEDQQRIFERFARASHGRRRSEGAGLGLSIVKAIAEAHGGQVSLRSQLGSGSTFAVILPLEPNA